MTTPQDPGDREQPAPFPSAPPPPPERQPSTPYQGEVSPNAFAAPPLTAADLGAGAPIGEAPKELRIASYLWIGVAVLLLVAAVLTVTSYDAAVDAGRQANSGLTDEQLRTGIAFFIGAFVVIDVVFAALFALFATKLKAGKTWARVWLLILGAVVFFIQVLSLSLLSVLTGVLIIGGVVLMNLKPSSDYLAAQRRA